MRTKYVGPSTKIGSDNYIGATKKIGPREVAEPEGKRKKTPVYALSLDGVSGSVKVNAAASINNLSTFSIVGKIYPYTLGQANLGTIFNKSLAKTIFIRTTNKLRSVMSFTGIDGTWDTPDNSIVLNSKLHIVVTYDNTDVANDVIAYINNVSQTITEISTPTLVANTDNTSNLYIGTNFGTGWTMNSLVYELEYFNVVLTPTQVSDLYNESVKPNDIAGCVLYHDYTLGHAQDLSGNGNHGTLQGNAQFIVDYEVEV